MMKKIAIVLTLISAILCFSPIFFKKTANADSGAEIVLRVEKEGVYFYSRNDFLEEHKLFLLTKTYFLIGVDMGDYYAVQYKKDTNAEISGFVKKSEVEIYDDGVPSLLYPVFKAETTRTSFPLYYNINTLENINGFPENLNGFYGKITVNGETYIVVYYEGAPPRRGIFYVSYTDFLITEPEAHPIPLKIIPNGTDEPGEEDSKESPDNSNETVQIIIIVAVIIFAVAVVYFMFRPNNYKYKRNKDDDEM